MDTARRTMLLGGAILAGGLATGLGPALCSLARPGGQTGAGPTPQRPAGTARPPLVEDIAPILERLDTWYAGHLTAPPYRFNPPATDEAIDRLQAVFGHILPPSYRQLYRWHDGETDDRWGHIYGLPILPLEDVAAELKSWERTRADFGGNRYAIPGAGWPAGAVDPAYSNAAWLPLTRDGSGNHIGLDFDPWPGGRVGQVIVFGRDEDVKAVLAPSLGTFLEWIATLLEAGNFRLEAAPGEQVLRVFRLKNPKVDGFTEGARKMLGAPGPFL